MLRWFLSGTFIIQWIFIFVDQNMSVFAMHAIKCKIDKYKYIFYQMNYKYLPKKLYWIFEKRKV